ncbi:protein unzipped-like [Uranotaenia lowii]|uniref:protein unzipped-like n=1 Tax=Uranotaenia lowii TaxID=190385 RepID=UPI00247857EE|nr:protein unzipped-like [Uranotaenia lowii]
MSTRRPNSRSWNRRSGSAGNALLTVLLLQLATSIGSSLAMTNSVFKAFSKDQTVTSSTLAWEKFNGEKLQLQNAVKLYDPVEHPRYRELVESDQLAHTPFVCRIQIEGIFCVGQTHMEDTSTICTASLQSDIRRHRMFEILINRGNGGKLKWQSWNKYRTEKFLGAVSASNGKVDDYYVARYKLDHHSHHHPYIVGNYDPLEKLGGRIFAPLPGVPDSVEHERGDILVEIEPVQYELRDIKLNKLRTVIRKNTTILGATVLSNDEDITNQAETVITYDYAKVSYYGRQESVVNGVQTKVIDPRTQQPVDMYWGVELTERKFETKAINTILQPGTAINVTLLGNYTEMEAPYHALLKAYYNDNSDPVPRKLNGYGIPPVSCIRLAPTHFTAPSSTSAIEQPKQKNINAVTQISPSEEQVSFLNYRGSTLFMQQFSV